MSFECSANLGAVSHKGKMQLERLFLELFSHCIQ
jgi:hypothetical protein